MAYIQKKDKEMDEKKGQSMTLDYKDELEIGKDIKVNEKMSFDLKFMGTDIEVRGSEQTDNLNSTLFPNKVTILQISLLNTTTTQQTSFSLQITD